MAELTNFTEDNSMKTLSELRCKAEFTGKVHSELIFLSVLNTFLSITAILENTLILVALHKDTSLHPPSKLLFRNLAITDLFVGITAEPLFVVYLMSEVRERWDVCFYVLVSGLSASYILCSVSFLTMTAISVDRLLALSLRLRYRQVVTFKRTCITIIGLWICSIVGASSWVFESCYNRMVSIHRYCSVSFHHIFRLHKNFLHPSPQPNSCSSPHFPKATKPSNSNEHSSIQKGGVQYTVGAGNIGCLLSSSGYSGSFNAPKRNLYIHVPQ